jgi:hypothetical protein
MDVWTTLILLAALVVLLTRSAEFLMRRHSLHVRRRFNHLDPRQDGGLRGERGVPQMSRPAH